MNNEEKILAILEGMRGDIAGLKETVEKQGASLTRLERRVGQIDARVDQIDERSQRTALLLEVEVARKINLLYEGHETIMETLDKLASKSRVEELEADIIVLKTAVRMLSQEVSELKKAQ